MQLIEVQNNIAKVLYKASKNRLIPSDFLLIEDINQKIIAQITGIQTTDNSDQNIAFLRLSLSIDKDDKLSLYNGYIPSKKSKIIYINPEEITELIKGDGISFYFGTLANHPQCYVKTNIDFFNNKLYVRSDKEDMTQTVLKNIVFELKNKNKKAVVIDTEGKYSDIKNASVIKLSEDLKLPLNIEAFNNILENDIGDCNPEEKAIIQSIILEVREYIQTLKDQFLPFSAFKNVVDDVFISNPSSGLMMFRNKLWMYSQNHLFSETDQCFKFIDEQLEKSSIVVIDISKINSNWYDYTIKTILNMITKKCCLILSLEDFSSDKKFITSLYGKNNVTPIVTTSYNHKSSQILKSVCQNYLLCKPSLFYSENELYTDVLNRINSEEIILFGEGTLYLPIIAELKAIDENVAEEVTDNEIKRDVDKLLSSSSSVINPQIDTSNINIEPDLAENTDELLDSDLDFLDELSAETTEESNSYDVFVPENEENDNTVNSEIEYGYNPEYTEDNSETAEDSQEITENIPETTEDIPETTEDIPETTEDIPETTKDIPETIEDIFEITEDIPEIIEDNSGEIKEDEPHETEISEFTDDKDTLADISTDNEKNEEPESQVPSEITPETETSDDRENDFVPESEETDEIIKNSAEQDAESIEIQDTSEDNIESEDSVIDSMFTDDEDSTEDITSIDDVVSDIKNKIENDDNNFVLETSVNDISNENDENSEKEKTEENQTPPEIKQDINIKQRRELPVYETDTSYPLGIDDLPFKTGDTVYHPKHGKGIVEGFTNYSNKILFCQINFENVGRRILDPRVAGIEKAE